jgi:hypothetical protein
MLRTWCTVPAGIQMARVGGTIHWPPCASTTITPCTA